MYFTEEECIKIIKETYLEKYENKQLSFTQIPEAYLSRELCLLAVKRDGNNINYVPYDMQDQEMYLVALEDGFPLDEIPMRFLDRKMCIAAIKNGYNPVNFLVLEKDGNLYFTSVPLSKAGDLLG